MHSEFSIAEEGEGRKSIAIKQRAERPQSRNDFSVFLFIASLQK